MFRIPSRVRVRVRVKIGDTVSKIPCDTLSELDVVVIPIPPTYRLTPNSMQNILHRVLLNR